MIKILILKMSNQEEKNDANKINEIASKYPSNYIESIAFRSIYQEHKSLNLSEILNVIREKANRNVSADAMAVYEIKLASGDDITISRRVNDAASLFSDQYFLKNYQTAFKKQFQAKKYKSKLFSGLELSVENDLRLTTEQTITLDELLDFKFLVCFFFGLWFHIELEECFCYPTSLRDWVAYSAGVTKNCIDSKCISHLELNKEEFDPMVHYDCGDKQLNIAFTMLNQLGNNNKIILNLRQGGNDIKSLSLEKK